MSTNNLKISTAVETLEGSQTVVKRLFPIKSGIMNFDPFVLWDHFNITPGTRFSDHPHRGFEAITYLFSGSIEHKDNLGNQSTVYAGGAQRFTAGKGIVHSEMAADNESTTGIQLWITLPHKYKQNEPSYQQVNAEDIPETIQGGVRVRSIVEENIGIQLLTLVQYLDVKFEEDSKYKINVPDSHRGFVYIVNGDIQINAICVGQGSAVYFENNETLSIEGVKNSQVMVVSGHPQNEPIHQRGSYVD